MRRVTRWASEQSWPVCLLCLLAGVFVASAFFRDPMALAGWWEYPFRALTIVFSAARHGFWAVLLLPVFAVAFWGFCCRQWNPAAGFLFIWLAASVLLLASTGRPSCGWDVFIPVHLAVACLLWVTATAARKRAQEEQEEARRPRHRYRVTIKG